MSNILEVIQSADILVCVGSGGVGKTTVASSLAYKAACMGRKVLVLTVDPAQRLKSTMGIEKGNESVQIKHPEITGELWASIIDAQKTFDQFVLKATKYSANTQKLLNNKLYIQLSTTLSGSQEFTALEKLYSEKESKKYDLIILDTPPTKHAIDFLEAPQKLSLLFNESVAKWFRPQERTLFARMLHAGTQKVLNILEMLTGSEFMRELADFFQNIEAWQGKLEQRIIDVHKMLVSERTKFILVSSFDQAKFQEAKYFFREIIKGGYHLSALIINRAYPQWVTSSMVENQPELEAQMRHFYKQRGSQVHALQNEIECVLQIPEIEKNISDFAGVQVIAKELK